MKKDKLIITSIGESKQIGRVLANDKARAILDLLAEKPMTAAGIAQKMNLPLTTVDYSLKKLEAAGLVKSRSGFNKNIRIAKFYEPQEKFIVIAPKQMTDVVSALKGLLPAFVSIGIVSALLEIFVRVPVSSIVTVQKPSQTGGEAVAGSINEGVQEAVQETVRETVVTTLVNPHYGAVFFLIATALVLFYAVWKHRTR